MASKAEVEKMARHIWYRVLGVPRAPCRRWEDLAESTRDEGRRVARWHLRKVKQAYSRGLDDVRGSGDYD